jgi:hypothetical protein
MAFVAINKVGARLSAIRLDPLPLEGDGRSLHWACFASQDEIDDWRLSADHAFAVLEAAERWLGGTFSSYGNALAAAIPLPPLWSAIQGCLDSREADVLRRRTSNETLDAIGHVHQVTRERVRQLEAAAFERLSARVSALRAVQHPAFLALSSHLRRLAGKVLTAACEQDGMLADAARERWIRNSLAPPEAEILLTLSGVADDSETELREALDPLRCQGKPFQGGRTLLPWSDQQVEDLSVAFSIVVGDQERRWARLEEVCAVAALSPEAVVALAGFANLTVEGNFIFLGRLKAADVRRVVMADILGTAGRPMHIGELMEEAILQGVLEGSSLRDFHNAMSDEPDMFASDGRAVWQMADGTGNAVVDMRPDHPEMPPPMGRAELLEALAAMERSRPVAASPLLENLQPEQPDFAMLAGGRLADALSMLPMDERKSLAQIMNADDEIRLLGWLRQAHLSASLTEPLGSLSRAQEALTMLAAFAVAIRSVGDADSPFWEHIWDACGDRARSFVFNTQRAPRSEVLSRLVEVAARYHLRRAFAFRSDPWFSLLGLQAGLLKNHTAIARWLSSGTAPIAIRQMVTPGDNYSRTMAVTWNVLHSYRRLNVGADAVKSVSLHSEWWPGWSAEEACIHCKERAADDAQPPEADPRTFQIDDLEHTANAEAEPRTGTGRVLPKPTEGPAIDEKFPLGTIEVTIAENGEAFILRLPERLALAPGPITLHGEGVRIGGMLHGDGSVRWNGEQRSARLGLRGRGERTVRLLRADEVLAVQTLHLWREDDYLVAFTLGAGRGRRFDPFLSPLPRNGGLALLLHQTLTVSADADAEYPLDGSYVLKIFLSGLPVGSTVSCEGESVWEAEHLGDSPRMVTDLATQMVLDGAAQRWGARTDLLMLDPPNGFVPHRARIGAQSIAAHQDGLIWRFQGYALLPGMDSLRRRGRVDGLLDGERASLATVVSLAQAPTGAALRDGGGWQPLDPDGIFSVARHRQSLIWACLPDSPDKQDWVLFEGPRPALAYSQQGVRAGHNLLALGENLRVEPRRFNLSKAGVQLSRFVIDTGVVADCGTAAGMLNLHLTVPIGWTDRHQALAWSSEGLTELVPVNGAASPTMLVFAPPDHEVDGICLFNGSAWLGTGLLTQDVCSAAAAFVSRASAWPDALRLAVSGHLPILAHKVASAANARLRTDGGSGVTALCCLPPGRASAHAIGSLLEAWVGSPGFCEAAVDRFLRSTRERAEAPSVLERLASDAPCTVVRIAAHGVQALPRRDRRPAVQKLVGRLLNMDAQPPSTDSAYKDSEAGLLAEAEKVSGLDPSFLASKAEASIVSLAWANATASTPVRPESNLATALAIDPIRRWLGVHMLSRLADLVI